MHRVNQHCKTRRRHNFIPTKWSMRLYVLCSRTTHASLLIRSHHICTCAVPTVERSFGKESIQELCHVVCQARYNCNACRHTHGNCSNCIIRTHPLPATSATTLCISTRAWRLAPCPSQVYHLRLASAPHPFRTTSTTACTCSLYTGLCTTTSALFCQQANNKQLMITSVCKFTGSTKNRDTGGVQRFHILVNTHSTTMYGHSSNM